MTRSDFAPCRCNDCYLISEKFPTNSEKPLETMLCITFVLLTITIAARSDWTDCPLPCRCKWTSGKKTALCSSSGLTALPNISSDVQVLDLQNNFITYLKSEAFYSIELINLQKIFMKNTSLTVLHRDAFKKLTILIEVDISDNQLSLIPQGTFSGNDRLRVVILNGNPLKELPSEQFPILPHLRTLEIENCKLQAIHRNAFVNLRQLEKLSLTNNLLKTLSDSVFKPIVKLKSLALENNPWKCDCKLRSLRNWFLLSKLHSISLLCSEPESLKQKIWEEVDPREFACPPTVQVSTKMVQRDIGENVTFTCLARGDPEPNVTWYFNGHQIDTQNATNVDQLLIVEMDEGLLEKWINITLVNLTDANAGEYTCIARNFVGKASHNVSLVLPQVVTATTLSKADLYSPIVGLVCGGIATVVACIIIGLICGYQKKRKLNMQKGRVKGRGSFTDQEKKLLDISITSTTEQSPGMCEQAHSFKDQNQAQGMVIPIPGPFPAAVGVYPPPAEFASNVLTPSGFGNIFISVSVSQDPYSDIQRYPDLLDIPYKSSNVAGVSPVASVAMPGVSYATLPRRPTVRGVEPAPAPANDKLGPRVTVEGSSILYHPESKDIIPPPPLPPQCSSYITEYVSL
ncbi:uncharacterized protein LOC143912406 [Arctopsyche grandis]|uniref:uncharacterized protein LOC143912406 n=1 Tax=Arctopsyche grandis TaxID=121162 RepID=UPI00406D66C0